MLKTDSGPVNEKFKIVEKVTNEKNLFTELSAIIFSCFLPIYE